MRYVQGDGKNSSSGKKGDETNYNTSHFIVYNDGV